jgi:hypothetical protein
MMIQQSLNASRIAGEKNHENESKAEFQAQLAKEQVIIREQSVDKAEQIEHRRIEREKDREQEPDAFIDPEGRMFAKMRDGADAGKTEEEIRKERLMAGGVGFEIDIDI